MLPIEENPRINQRVVRELTGLGVTLVAQEDAATVVAQFPAPVHLDESGRIFKKLDRLGVNGYDQKSLKIRTVEGVVNVSMALL